MASSLNYKYTNQISNAAITTFSVQKDYVRIASPNIDATPFNYNAMFTDRTGNNCLNSNFMKTQDTINGTKNLTQQEIQTPSNSVNEDIFSTMPTRTQESISPIHPTLTTPHNKNTTFPQRTIQSPVKPSVAPKFSQMDYQTFGPVTKSRQSNKQKLPIKIIFQNIVTFFCEN